VLSRRHAIYIVGLSEFYGITNIIHVTGSRKHKGVRLYGKYDYYPICPKKLVRISWGCIQSFTVKELG
jgi:hypothetical protein